MEDDVIKRIRIRTPGNQMALTATIPVTPKCTAYEVLLRAHLTDYSLCPTDTELPFDFEETIFDKIEDNAVLFAYRQL